MGKPRVGEQYRHLIKDVGKYRMVMMDAKGNPVVTAWRVPKKLRKEDDYWDGWYIQSSNKKGPLMIGKNKEWARQIMIDNYVGNMLISSNIFSRIFKKG